MGGRRRTPRSAPGARTPVAPRPSVYQRRAKRLLDLCLTATGLLLFSPLLLAVALSVWFGVGRPVLFRQTRVGLRARTFILYKFRTMTEKRDRAGRLLSDEDRLTNLGLLLRTFSLDELPTLFNVLRGDMSMVGPRPLLVRYLSRYSAEQMRRHLVLPGITGWTQVNGRNALTWEQKFEHDVWYVDHISLTLDLKILLLTVWKVLKREGISQPGYATAEEFMGTAQGHTATTPHA
jgi:sugar transferase EpsL